MGGYDELSPAGYDTYMGACRGWGNDRAAAASASRGRLGLPEPSLAPALLRGAPAVLQDMAVGVAEGVAEAYLAEASAGTGAQ